MYDYNSNNRREYPRRDENYDRPEDYYYPPVKELKIELRRDQNKVLEFK